LELSRPPANAFNEEFWIELKDTFEKINFEGEVRVVVLASSNPKFFTAGLDLKSAGDVHQVEAGDPARKGLFLRQHILDFQKAISSIEDCKYPVICAINGYALGLAIDIACACDIRFAASDTKFSIKEVDIGLAADIGTLARFPKIIGNESLARELAMTTRVFSADEAYRMGFISRAIEGGRDEVITAALQTARTIASKSPIAVVGTKHVMLHARDHSVQENLDYTATWNALMLQGGDSQSALKSSKTKSPPSFLPLRRLNGKL